MEYAPPWSNGASSVGIITSSSINCARAALRSAAKISALNEAVKTAAATAKLYVGTALVVAFASDVVREPVACAGGIEIVCGVLLLLRAREAREWAETRRRLVREGTRAKDK